MPHMALSVIGGWRSLKSLGFKEFIIQIKLRYIFLKF